MQNGLRLKLMVFLPSGGEETASPFSCARRMMDGRCLVESVESSRVEQVMVAGVVLVALRDPSAILPDIMILDAMPDATPRDSRPRPCHSIPAQFNSIEAKVTPD